MTTTALVLIISGVLIGAGVSIIWRDLGRRRQRSAFVVQRGAASSQEPEAEIVIAPAGGGAGTALLTADGSFSRAPDAADSPANGGMPSAERTDGVRGGERVPAIEQRWAAVQPVIQAGVMQLNRELEAVGVKIGDAGDPTWSYKNRGYGAYRRVHVAGTSVGWLRLEISADGELNTSMKTHADARIDLDADARASVAHLSAAHAGKLLSQALRPTAGYAAESSRRAALEREESEKAWKGVDVMIGAALKATNGAFAQAGASLLPIAPAVWEEAIRRHRMTVAVKVRGNDVARMHIECIDREIEVAVGVRDAGLVELGRRRRIPVEGMTIHALAELIASCAWPSIARFREVRAASPSLPH